MAASSYFIDEDQCGPPVLPATRSPSDGTDIRWFFTKHVLPPDALAASVPKNAVVGRGEFLRFSARDSLALEAAYKKNEAYYDRAWWRELADCSSGPQGAPSSSPPNAAEDEDPSIIEEDTMGVPVKGGLYEVELETRRSFPVYWKGEDRRVLRGQWFARTHSSHWLPLREDVADQLEAAYQRRVWRRRSYEPSGLYAARVSLAGAQQGQSVLFTGDDSSWEAWLANEASWWPQVDPGIPLRRGFVSSLDSGAFTQEDVQQLQEEERDDYCSQVPVAHVVLMVHGIGQRMDTAHFVDDVTIFRRHTAALAEHHLTKDQRQRQRCLFIPCQWRRELRLAGEAAVEDITPEGVPALRKNVSATVHDVLFYMSPAYCQDIIDSVTSQLNFQYRKFKRRNPTFVGKVSIFGHSLGSVLAFDILCHQDLSLELQHKSEHAPLDPQVVSAIVEGKGGEQEGTIEVAAHVSKIVTASSSSSSTSHGPPGGGGPSATGPEGRWQSTDLPLRTDPSCTQNVEEESDHHDSDYNSARGGFNPLSSTPVTSEEGGKEERTAPPSPTHSHPTSLELARRRRPPRQHMPEIDYARLDFEVDTLFAVGSPLALFLALRNIRIGTGDGPELLEGIAEEIPACRRLLNIFHPYDPVAYRIEPLISREYVKIPPAYLAHFRGGRRLHIVLQELSDKLGGRVRHIAKGWLRYYQKVQACWEGIFSSRASKIHGEEDVQLQLEVDDYARHMMTRLTGRVGGRIDYALQEATFDYQYIVAFKCHLTYWSDWDTALCVIRHLYDDTEIETEAAGSVDAISLHQSPSIRDREREALDSDQQIALTFQSGGRGPVGLLRALQVARSSRKVPQ